MTRATSTKAKLAAGMLVLGGLAGVSFVRPAWAIAPATQAAPRFVYASGAQGVRYYANPGTAARVQSAPAPRTATTRGATVGPGVRDWTTGRQGRLHKPWLSPR